MMALAGPGDEVLVGDPMYATYEGLIRASGAVPVPVTLSPEHGFRLQATDIAGKITPATRAILLNTPHNPTGAILRPADLDAICVLAKAHDLWVISDEVYGDLTHGNAVFTSALANPAHEARDCCCLYLEIACGTRLSFGLAVRFGRVLCERAAAVGNHALRLATLYRRHDRCRA